MFNIFKNKKQETVEKRYITVTPLQWLGTYILAEFLNLLWVAFAPVEWLSDGQVVIADAPEPNQLGFQDPATPIMEHIINLHDHIFFFLILVSVGVVWILFVILKLFTNKLISHKYLIHGTIIEIVWTVTPAFILVSIAFPSFKLLYLMDEVIEPVFTIKAIGHQWYWSYEFTDYYYGTTGDINFDSYMIPTDELTTGGLRLLEVDNKVVVPVKTPIRVIITAADVLHAWAVPSLGIKLDAVPGRLNQTSMYVKRPGVYYGQCSELCGVQHGFMPIVVKAVSPQAYFDSLQATIGNAIIKSE